MFGIASFSQAPFSSLSENIVLGIANIDVLATITANANSIFSVNALITSNVQVEVNGSSISSAIGSITGFSTVSALGGFLNSANAQINSFATIVTSPNATWAGFAYVEGNGTITAKGNRLGEEWNTSTAGTETWTNVSVGTNTWTETTTSDNTWLRQG